jgi:hypothetical protein
MQRFASTEAIADATLFLAQNGAVIGSALRAEGGIIRALRIRPRSDFKTSAHHSN